MILAQPLSRNAPATTSLALALPWLTSTTIGMCRSSGDDVASHVRPVSPRPRILTIAPSEMNRSTTPTAAVSEPPPLSRKSRMMPETPSARMRASAASTSASVRSLNCAIRMYATRRSGSMVKRQPSASRSMPFTLGVSTTRRGTLSVRSLPSARRITNAATVPGAPGRSDSSVAALIPSVDFPSTERMVSPARMPASIAGDPSMAVITIGRPSSRSNSTPIPT